MQEPPRAPDIAEIFNAHAPYVWRVLRRLGVPETDVEDVCQEVFLVVHRRLPDFEGRSSLRTWLYGICLRRAANHRTGAGRQRELLQVAAPEPAEEPGQHAHVEQRQALRWLDDVLSELPIAQREGYVLYELEQLTMQEVADAIGCPLQTAYSRLHAARRHVRQAVSPTAPRLRVS